MHNRMVAVLASTLGILVLSAGSVLAVNPPGNNGTVKVDGLTFADTPNNEPHVGCTFRIKFFGYDEGDLHATATFKLIPPTAGGVLLEDSTFIGEDPAGGGKDLDASLVENLSGPLAASDVSPQPHQGFHIKLIVHAEGSKGADVKHKTFWVRGCGCGCGGTH